MWIVAIGMVGRRLKGEYSSRRTELTPTAKASSLFAYVGMFLQFTQSIVWAWFFVAPSDGDRRETFPKLRP